MHKIRRAYREIDTAKNKNVLLKVLSVLLAPIILYRYCVQFAIPYIEMVVTPKCTLRCVGCSNLMPLYAPGTPHNDINMLKRSIDALLSVSRRITEMKLIGGEPFMHPHLHEIVRYASQKKQIKKITIITNGTIVPRGENLQCLRRKNITVNISRYPVVDPMPLINALQDNGVLFHLVEFEAWQDYGNMDQRGLDTKTLEKSFAACAAAECKTVMDGHLFACPREAHGRALGLITADFGVASLLEVPPRQLKQSIRALYSLPYTPACDYCTPIWQRKEIACAGQMPAAETEGGAE